MSLSALASSGFVWLNGRSGRTVMAMLDGGGRKGVYRDDRTITAVGRALVFDVFKVGGGRFPAMLSPFAEKQCQVTRSQESF